MGAKCSSSQLDPVQHSGGESQRQAGDPWDVRLDCHFGEIPPSGTLGWVCREDNGLLEVQLLQASWLPLRKDLAKRRTGTFW